MFKKGKLIEQIKGKTIINNLFEFILDRHFTYTKKKIKTPKKARKRAIPELLTVTKLKKSVKSPVIGRACVKLNSKKFLLIPTKIR